MPLSRKRAIYDVCVRHDVIIVEDDPYYFLQFDDDDHNDRTDGGGHAIEDGPENPKNGVKIPGSIDAGAGEQMGRAKA